MKIKILFLILTIFWTSIGNAQKVSRKELEEKQSQIDTSAGAEILYAKQETYFEYLPGNIFLITEVHKKIKFYNDTKDALDFATVDVRLYKRDHQKEKISKIEGNTYNLLGEEIITTVLDKKQIFEKEVSENREQVTFTMPDVKKGSVIEYSYKIRSPFYSFIDEVQFQYAIPVQKAVAEITIPKSFSFQKLVKGSVEVDLNEETKTDRRVNEKVNVYKYTAENIPALHEEKFVDNINNYRGGVVFELMSIKNRNGVERTYATSWADVARTIAYSDDYEDGIKRKGIFKKDLKAYLNNETDSIEKLNKVLQFAKDHIKWNGKYGKFFEAGIRKAYKDQIGNVADVNLALVAMLREAGFDASPVVLCTRNYMRPLFPTVDHLNYVIARVELNNQKYVLDATDLYSELNVLPNRVYNWYGVFIDTPNKLWKHINLNQPAVAEGVNMVMAEIKEDGSISGTVRETNKNHYAYRLRKKYFSESEEEYLRSKESDRGNIEISEYELSNIDAIGEVVENYSYHQEKGYEKISGKIYLNPLLFYTHSENPFKADKRSYPVDFIYPFQDYTVINFKLPEGYRIEKLPESVRLNFAGLGNFEYLVSGEGPFMRVTVKFSMNESRIEEQNYESLKSFFDKMLEKESEQIILTKV